MVFIALNHTLHTVQMHSAPFLFVIAGNFMHSPVGFDICLVDDIHPIFVTQLIPVSVIGIVRCADGVDIGLLHQDDVLFHQFMADRAAGIRRRFVAIESLDNDVLPIHK